MNTQSALDLIQQIEKLEEIFKSMKQLVDIEKGKLDTKVAAKLYLDGQKSMIELCQLMVNFL